MMTFLIGLVALFVIVVAIWMLHELIDLIADLVVGVGPRGCLALLIMLAIIGILVYALGSLIAPLFAPLVALK